MVQTSRARQRRSARLHKVKGGRMCRLQGGLPMARMPAVRGQREAAGQQLWVTLLLIRGSQPACQGTRRLRKRRWKRAGRWLWTERA